MNRRLLVQSLPRPIRHGVIDACAFIRQQRRSLERERPPLDYWVAPPGNGHGNSPEAYATQANNWDAELLLSTVNRLLPNAGTVLEFGCNAGRVLRHFAPRELIGLELNPNAVALAQRTFPELGDARFLVGNGEQTLKTLGTDSVQVSYSCHALRHVGPSIIRNIAQELARVTASLIITIEDEGSWSTLNFPRNYRRLFEPFGWRQIEKHYSLDLGNDEAVSMTSVIRIFAYANSKAKETSTCLPDPIPQLARFER